MRRMVYDNYDPSRKAWINTHLMLYPVGKQWITDVALHAAEKRAGMMPGSYLKVDGERMVFVKDKYNNLRPMAGGEHE